MEVTDRLCEVTQVTFQYDISSNCHSHRTLISTMLHAFTLVHFLSLSHCYFNIYKNNAHVAKCGSDELQTKGYGDHFSNEEGVMLA